MNVALPAAFWDNSPVSKSLFAIPIILIPEFSISQDSCLHPIIHIGLWGETVKNFQKTQKSSPYLNQEYDTPPTSISDTPLTHTETHAHERWGEILGFTVQLGALTTRKGRK